MKQIIIAGGGYAGILAANRLATHFKGLDYLVTLINQCDSFIERIREHEVAAGLPFRRRPITTLLHPSIKFQLSRIETIDATHKQIKTNEGYQNYDALIYALGSTGRPFFRDTNSFCIGTLGEAERFRYMLTKHSANIVIIGGGLTGIETATELAEANSNFKVTLVHAGSLNRDYSPKGSHHIRNVLQRLQIRFIENQRVINSHESVVELQSGTVLSADQTIQTSGFWGSPVAKISKLPVNNRDQLLVDATLAVPQFEGLFGTGDAIALPQEYHFLRMGCVSAMPLGAHVADSVIRYFKKEPLRSFRFGFPFRCISLGRRDGLIQFTDPFDRPNRYVVTGRNAALIKEQVCRWTVGILKLEMKTGWRLLQWRRGPKSI